MDDLKDIKKIVMSIAALSISLGIGYQIGKYNRTDMAIFKELYKNVTLKPYNKNKKLHMKHHEEILKSFMTLVEKRKKELLIAHDSIENNYVKKSIPVPAIVKAEDNINKTFAKLLEYYNMSNINRNYEAISNSINTINVKKLMDIKIYNKNSHSLNKIYESIPDTDAEVRSLKMILDELIKQLEELNYQYELLEELRKLIHNYNEAQKPIDNAIKANHKKIDNLTTHLEEAINKRVGIARELENLEKDKLKRIKEEQELITQMIVVYTQAGQKYIIPPITNETANNARLDEKIRNLIINYLSPQDANKLFSNMNTVRIALAEFNTTIPAKQVELNNKEAEILKLSTDIKNLSEGTKITIDANITANFYDNLLEYYNRGIVDDKGLIILETKQRDDMINTYKELIKKYTMYDRLCVNIRDNIRKLENSKNIIKDNISEISKKIKEYVDTNINLARKLNNELLKLTMMLHNINKEIKSEHNILLKADKDKNDTSIEINKLKIKIKDTTESINEYTNIVKHPKWTHKDLMFGRLKRRSKRRSNKRSNKRNLR